MEQSSTESKMSQENQMMTLVFIVNKNSKFEIYRYQDSSQYLVFDAIYTTIHG